MHATLSLKKISNEKRGIYFIRPELVTKIISLLKLF